MLPLGFPIVVVCGRRRGSDRRVSFYASRRKVQVTMARQEDPASETAMTDLAVVGDNRGEGAGSEGDLNGRKRRLRAAATTMIAAATGRRSRLGYGSGSRVQDPVEGDRDHGEEMMLAVVQ
ncbi:hypothetical protein B296_00004840 [Ensete ventricosum]|uniref:Uncharacterized protein n=1 Tax=Ensete ventricosum TaxID=4639 RepID=A0A426ZUL0_ENSVE|nr:hypothetical protein B296_00004840 [Ensete ventricosum]